MRIKSLSLLLAAAGFVAVTAFAAVDAFRFTNASGNPVLLNFTRGGAVNQVMPDGSTKPAADGKYKASNGSTLDVKGGQQVGSFSWGMLTPEASPNTMKITTPQTTK